MRKSLYLSAALALTIMAGVTSSPVFAKDKAPAAETVSDKIRPFLAAAQAANTKKDYATAIAQANLAEPLAVSPFEKFIVGQMKAVAGQGSQDNKLMLAGLEAAADSGYVSPAAASFSFLAGQLEYNNQNYIAAIKYLALAQSLGSPEPVIPLIIADSYFKAKQTTQGLDLLEKAFAADAAAGRITPLDTLARAAQGALDGNMIGEANKWLMRSVAAYPSKTTWHDLLAIYRDRHPQIGTQRLLDLYRLMKATGSFTNAREVGEYAETALKGLPAEAKSAIEDAQATGVVKALTSTMAETKSIATTRAAADRATLPSYEKQSLSAPNGKIAQGTADDLIGYKEYAKAIALYKVALQKGGVDINIVTMRLGEVYALSGDKANAKAAFATVTGDVADIAKFWMLYADQLK